MGVCLYVSGAPLSDREASSVAREQLSTEVDNSIPTTTSFDGVSLLRKTLIQIYEEEIEDLTARLTGNLRVIDKAVLGDNDISPHVPETQPTLMEKRSEPLIIGRSTNLHLYVLSRKLAELRYEEKLRNIESNERKFQQYG